MNTIPSMNWVIRIWALTSLLAAATLAATLAAAPALAQPPAPLTPQPEVYRNLALHPQPERSVRMEAAAAAAIPPLGSPGLSFRYVQTFGETGVPYFEDTQHLFYPAGLGTIGNNIWIVESKGKRVLKYTSSGQFVAQIGKAGITDYYSLPMNSPSDAVAADDGTLWLAGGWAANVLVFDPAGKLVQSIGETWSCGSDNTHFCYPASVVRDAAGHLYVSDGSDVWNTDIGNHRVQVFDAQGVYLATIGTSGSPGSGNLQFHGPRGLAIYDSLLYVVDGGNQRVQIINIANPAAPAFVATLGVTGEEGNDNTHFSGPTGVAVDANYVYVADRWNHRVQVFQRATLAYVATIGEQPSNGDYQFDELVDVAVDATGNIYVSDQFSARVQQYNAARQYVRTFGVTGQPYTTDNNHYNEPMGVDVASDGSIYIVEAEGNRLIKLTAAGQPLWTIGTAGVPGGWNGENYLLNHPDDVAVGPNGDVYVADIYNRRVQVYNASGAYIRTLGISDQAGSDNNHFGSPCGLGFGPEGRLYVADCDNYRVQVFDANLNYIATLGVTGQRGSDNAHFVYPHDVAVDSKGIIYVVDHDVDRVQVFNADYTYQRTMGETGQGGGDFTHFEGPGSVAVDSQDRLYVGDGWNGRVQVFDSSGAYLTTIGGGGSARTGDLKTTFAVAVDDNGNVYAADRWDNHRVQKFAPGVPGWVQANINGFGTPYIREVLAFSVFNNALYAGVARWDGSGALRIMRSTDGRQWTEAMGNAAGSPYDYAVNSLEVFKGRLYAGLENWNWTENRSEGGSVWRSDDGSSWTKVVANGFGDPEQASVYSLVVFKDQLYATTAPAATTKGPEIWRSVNDNGDDWERVVSNSFGTVNNRFIPAFKVFGDHLYAATFNEIDGGQLWRTADGVDWQPISEDGFSNGANSAISSLEVFNGVLYAGTRNLTQGEEIWRSDNGADWTRVVLGGLNGQKHRGAYALTSAYGYLYAFVYSLPEEALQAQVWRTADGISWQPVSIPGWGDVNNAGSGYDGIGFLFNGSLYFGTSNIANGGEVWQYTPDRVSVTIDNPGAAATLAYTDTASGAMITVFVPADAVTQTTTLVYEGAPLVEPPSGWRLAAAAFDLSAFQNSAKVSGFTFAKPVTFVFHYTAASAASVDESTLTLMHRNNTNGQWEEAACGEIVRQTSEHTISVPVCSLSQFVLVGEPRTATVYLPLVRR